MSSKLNGRKKKVRRLAKFAATQPQAAYAAYTHGLINRWVYSLRVTTPVDESLLKPLEDVVLQKLIPALTGQSTPNGNTRALLALPVGLGGMGIVNPTTLPTVQHQSSVALCKPLSSLIDSQELHANMAASSKDQAAIKGATTRNIGWTARKKRKMSFGICHQNNNAVLRQARRRARHLGCPPCPSIASDLPSTKVLSRMQLLFSKAGHCI